MAPYDDGKRVAKRERERTKNKNQAEYVIMVTCVCWLFLAKHFVYAFFTLFSVLSLRLTSALVFVTHSIWIRLSFYLSLSPYRFLTYDIFYARRQAKRKWSDIFYTVTLCLMPLSKRKKIIYRLIFTR